MKSPVFLVAALSCCLAATVPPASGAPVAALPPKLLRQTHRAPAPRFWRDRLNGHKYLLPAVIGGKSVSFYLANPKVSSLAKALYMGHFRPSDNDSTSKLLSLVTTDAKEVRPFYRWCLDFTISISDGALGEYPGQPALAYASKFPQEFFAYMDKDASGQRYKEWVEIIAYSGLRNYPASLPTIKKEITTRMTKSCRSGSPLMSRRIRNLATDIAIVVKRNDG